MYRIIFLITFIICSINSNGQIPGPYNSDIKTNYIRTWEPAYREKDPAIITAASTTVEKVKQSTEYMDGIGRLLQRVEKGTSPLVNGTGKFDFVASVTYNNAGLQEYQFLPYTATTTDGAFKINPFNDQSASLATEYPGEQTFYSHTIFENSPAHRVLNSMPVGNSWAGSNRGAVNQYNVNIPADAVVLWISNGIIPVSMGNYATGTLYKQTVTDESGRKTVKFTNFKNQDILIKKQLTSTADGHAGWLCTYYVYDALDRLAFIIPPAAVEVISSDWSFTNRAQVLDDLCYQYTYDTRNRIITKKIPGASKVEMVYDNRDRLVFSRDGNLLAAQKWHVTFYDDENRSVLEALYNSTDTRTGLQQLMNTATGNKVVAGSITEQGGDMFIYERDAAITKYTASSSITFADDFESALNDEFETSIEPNGGKTDATVTVTNPLPNLVESALTPLVYNYYDNYNWPGSLAYNTATANKLITGNNQNAEPVVKSNYTKGLSTGSKRRIFIPGGEQWIVSTTYFNEKNLPIQQIESNLMGGRDILATRYDFSGKTISTYLQHNNPSSSKILSVGILTINEYDYGGRLIVTKKQLNNEPLKTIAQYKFDKLNKQTGKILGDNLQEENYVYNIRGWLQGMNRDYLTSDAKPYRFGYELAYDKTASVISGSNYQAAQFNGNIAGVTWRSTDGARRKYDYSYDAVRRLLKANFLENTGGGWNNSAKDFTVTVGDGMNPASAYDYNGNIKRLQQIGLKNGAPVLIDDLSYSYNANSNRLSYVRDNANDATATTPDFKEPAANNLANLQSGLADYDYDNNGNLKADKNKEISLISYNQLNLLEKINIDNKGSIEFVYDAAGNKLRKIVTDLTGGTSKKIVTDYDKGLVYEDNLLRSIEHEEGRIRPIYKSDVLSSFAYDYYVRDAQSNVRLVLTDQSDFSMYAATMETGSAEKENALFSNIDATRSVVPAGYPDAGNTRNKSVARLNAKQGGSKVGPSLVLRVMAGDTIQIGAKAFYKSQGPADKKYVAPIEDIVAGLVQAFGNQNASADVHSMSSSTTPFSSNFYKNDYQRLKQKDQQPLQPNRPKAYLNFVLFDEQFKLVDKNSGVRQVKENPDEIQVLAVDKMAVSKSGFLYVYTSNETAQDVFFDDVTVMDVTGPVLEETHYYPFGLTMEGLSGQSLPAKLVNRYGYNGKELQTKEFSDGSGLQWYDYGSRMYDVQVGRWNVPDGKSESYYSQSPYGYAGNNPVVNVDVDGNAYFPSYIPAPQINVQKIIDDHNNSPSVRYMNGEMSAQEAALYESDRNYANDLQQQNYRAIQPYISSGGGPVEYGDGSIGSNLFLSMTGAMSSFIPIVGPMSRAMAALRPGHVDGGAALLNAVFAAVDLGAFGSGLDGPFVLRAIRADEAASYNAGLGIYPKNPAGSWTLEEHLIRGSSKASWLNDPWISTSPDEGIVRAFDRGHGLIKINLSKLPETTDVKIGYEELPRSSGGYHYSIWQQEVSIFGHVPQSAIVPFK